MMTGDVGRLADIKSMTRLSRSTIDRLERKGEFPERIRLSKSAIGWRLDEVRAWLDRRPRDYNQRLIARQPAPEFCGLAVARAALLKTSFAALCGETRP